MHTIEIAGAVATCGTLLAAARAARGGRLLRIRVGLVEQRERDVLSAALAFSRASVVSSGCVFEELGSALRALAPHADVVALFERRGQEFGVSFSSGRRAQHLSAALFPVDRGSLLGEAVLSRSRTPLRSGRALLPGDADALAVPVRISGDICVLYISSLHAGTLEQAENLARLAELAAPSLQLAREREADRLAATYDGLTGLLTPRALRATLAQQIDEARVHGTALALWFVDTDNFKTVNDRFGHAAGDLVLQRMARILRNHARAEFDLVARNGGDEFCAILKHAPKSEAILRAARCCATVATTNFGVDAALSASIGVASFPHDALDAAALLELADAAMYHTKSSGRNGVSYCIAGGFERFSA